eukprot:gene10930-11013_t
MVPQPELIFAMLDNGSGMSEDQLVEAMRLASRNPKELRSKNDLGRFGLGLKTASFSQSRRLTVLSKKDGITSCRQWDLDFISEKNEWLLITPENVSQLPFYSELEKLKSGTLVCWQLIDRCDKSSLTDIIDQVRKHLALVFHRFLEGADQKAVKIRINNNPVFPFNPFNLSHPATQQLQLEKIKIYSSDVYVQPFILPHHSKLSQKEYEFYATEEGYIKSQGFYLYRGNRILIYGTWWNLHKTVDAHKLHHPLYTDLQNEMTTIGLEKLDIYLKGLQAYLPIDAIHPLERTKIGQEIQSIKTVIATVDAGTLALILPVVDFTGLSDSDWERMSIEFEKHFDVEMKHGILIQGDEQQNRDNTWWTAIFKQKTVNFYWDRYRKYLGNFLPPDVVKTIDTDTDIVMNNLENPIGKPFSRYGMVVGHVQSGKTGNYSALICKAADAGYKFIVVIAGGINNLRDQTQERLNESFIGQTKGVQVGAGIGNTQRETMPLSLTTIERDFNKQDADRLAHGLNFETINVPVLLVIKKNTRTLENVIDWLDQQYKGKGINHAMLVIDDESDYASINTKEEEDPTKINLKLRILLSLFKKYAYVAYTATPYANIFIDHEASHDTAGQDLFPKDFIYALDAPSNYFGARKIFIENADKYLVPIDDNEDSIPYSHKKDFTLNELPASLLEAIRLFTDVHKLLAALTEEYLSAIKKDISAYASLPDALSQSDILKEMPAFAESVVVREAARALQEVSLLKALVWFGYRPGYEDLCRIFMPADRITDFANIIEATENLILDFKLMAEQKKTPNDFGLAIQQNPDSALQIAGTRVWKNVSKALVRKFIKDFKTFDKDKLGLTSRMPIGFIKQYLEERPTEWDIALYNGTGQIFEHGSIKINKEVRQISVNKSGAYEVLNRQMMTKPAENPWASMHADTARRVDVETQYDFFWITDIKSRYGLLIKFKFDLSDLEIESKVKGISVITTKDENSGNLYFVLNSNKDWEIFLSVCTDLILMASQYSFRRNLASGLDLNFDLIWEMQDVPDSLIEMLKLISEQVYKKDIDIDFPEEDPMLFVFREDKNYKIKEAKDAKAVDKGIDAQIFVMKVSNTDWNTIYKYYSNYQGIKMLSTMHIDMLAKMASGRITLPSEKQAKVLYQIYESAKAEGVGLSADSN